MQPNKINELIDKCHSEATKNGWWGDLPSSEPERSEWLADKIDLIAGEGAKAVEALRNGRRADKVQVGYAKEHLQWLQDGKTVDFIGHFKGNIKDTFEDEIADIFIRTCDLMGFYGWRWEEDIGWMSSRINIIGTRSLIRTIRYEAIYCSLCDSWSNERANYILAACIRIAKIEGFDLDWHIKAKLAYNATRGKKHGKEF